MKVLRPHFRNNEQTIDEFVCEETIVTPKNQWRKDFEANNPDIPKNPEEVVEAKEIIITRGTLKSHYGIEA